MMKKVIYIGSTPRLYEDPGPAKSELRESLEIAAEDD
jgi:hypothetical protein